MNTMKEKEKTKTRREIAYDNMYEYLQTVYDEYHYRITNEKILSFLDKIFDRIEFLDTHSPENSAIKAILGEPNPDDELDLIYHGLAYPFVKVEGLTNVYRNYPQINIQWVLLKERGYYLDKRIVTIVYYDDTDDKSSYFRIKIKNKTYSIRNNIKNYMFEDSIDLSDHCKICFTKIDKFDVDNFISILIGMGMGYTFSLNEDDYDSEY